MRRLLALLVSLKLTAAILVVLSALLVLNVAVPQANVDPEGFARAAARGGVSRWLLVDAGLGRISTSPVFVGALAAFFVNLAAVLVDRTGATVRRVRFAAPSDAQARSLARDGVDLAAGTTVGLPDAERLLGRMGFRTLRVGPGALWGVKHRLALLGFPLFHLSFLVLAAGGIQLYLTREVVNFGGAEGETALSARGGVVRRAPLGPRPPFGVEIERVDPRLVRGSPVDLAVTLRLAGLPGPAQVARVNAPAVWGDLTVLVDRIGIAPVLWVQDADGFTRDRVAVVTSGGDLPTRVPLAGTSIEAVVEPIPIGAGFPQRDGLSTVPIQLRLVEGSRAIFDGALRRGEAARAGELVVVLEEVRYWIGLRAVSERGGGLLVGGFLLLVAGILWRMFWYRRDVVLLYEGDTVRLGGRADFNPGRFREELRQLGELLTAGPERRASVKP